MHTKHTITRIYMQYKNYKVNNDLIIINVLNMYLEEVVLGRIVNLLFSYYI